MKRRPESPAPRRPQPAPGAAGTGAAGSATPRPAETGTARSRSGELGARSAESASSGETGRGTFSRSRNDLRADRPGGAAQEREGWLRRMRLSGFSAIMVVVLILAVVIIAPNLKMFIEQQQQIGVLQAKVDSDKKAIENLKTDRERWKDETYITTQARNRLYYVNHGEVSFIVDNDLDPAKTGTDPTPVSDTVTTTTVRWDQHLLASFLNAGLGK